MNNLYVDSKEIENGFILASDDEISLLMPDWYEDSDEFYFIIKNDTNEVLGNIIYRYQKNEATGNVEYQIDKQFRGHNYAKKALKLLAKNMYKIDDEDLFISIHSDNYASIKTAIGAGAIFEKKVKIPKHYIFSEEGKYKYANMYIIKNNHGKNIETKKI